LLGLFHRLDESLSKRRRWRAHLAEAQQTIQALKGEASMVDRMVTIPARFRGRGYYRDLGLKQNPAELLGLAKALREYRLERICEIGTFRGGTLFIWCQLAEPSAHLFSIDRPGSAWGGGFRKRSQPFFESFLKPGQELHCLRGNSHAPRLRARLARALDGQPLDFLFLDGDHTYRGVKRDFEDYAGLVRAGGWIAFHDIVPQPDKPATQVHRFWQELKPGYRHREFIDADPQCPAMGIGLIYV
jgi:predicted O-methyltransferase YrrM